MKQNKDILWRVYLIYFGFVVAMVFVLFKTFAIQTEEIKSALIDGDSSTKIPIRQVERKPRSGEILDVNYTPLVTSVSFFDIYMDATVCKQDVFDQNINELCASLSSLFPQKSAKEYESLIRRARARGNRFLLIRRKATNQQRNKIKTFPIFNLGRNKGGLIENQETIIRKRPHGELLKRTLGYYQQNKDGVLRVGIEGAYHEYLYGEPGYEIEQYITNSWKKTGQIVKDPVEGANVITSIDKGIQEVAHNELLRQMKRTNAKNGSVVVMDVKTGFVKAVVNLTVASDGEYYETYNHAIGTKEVPGSTFKLASLMAALEDKKFSIYDTVDTSPKYTYFGKNTLNEAHNNYYGKISIKRAFELSSNVISKLIYKAYKNEPEVFVNRLKSFGLDQALGIELQGEPTPTMYSPGHKNWSGISLPWMSVGYEVQLTPLQMLTFYNAVANNGKMVKPQFVKKIIRGTEVVKEYKPITIKEKICSDNTLTLLQSCLEGVMKSGTGKNLTSSYFDIAGKTGTAEILNDNMQYGAKGERKYLASFIGYFPTKDPIYSCIVSVAASGENVYGSTVSGTVFSAIANKVYASNLKYHQAINDQKKKAKEAPFSKDGNAYDLKKILNHYGIKYLENSFEEWVSTKADGEQVVLNKRFVGKKTVPNVIGMTAKDAVYLIENTGMSVHLIGYGKVTKQTVAPGTAVFKGGLIELFLE